MIGASFDTVQVLHDDGDFLPLLSQTVNEYVVDCPLFLVFVDVRFMITVKSWILCATTTLSVLIAVCQVNPPSVFFVCIFQK